jgi:heat-inducible transcriptional repressor
MEMDERKIKILRAIINDYIHSGEPVGSRTIAKRYSSLCISPATIRNEMADLEEMGYLEQLHTSSGRIPSDKGYRLYVDNFMKVQELSEEEDALINKFSIGSALFELDKIIKSASVLVSELTKLICVVKTPSVRKSRLKTIQLINVDNTTLLSIILTDSGIVKNNFIRISRPINYADLEKVNNLLNSRLKNLTIEQIGLEVINRMKQDLTGYEDIFTSVIPLLYDGLNDDNENDVFMQGETNILLHPEYNDLDKTRQFLYFLNNKDTLSQLLSSEDELTISIGEENYLPEARNYTIISKVYGIDDTALGSIGIIGPTRMDYSKVISILDRVTKQLNDNINNYDK